MSKECYTSYLALCYNLLAETPYWSVKYNVDAGIFSQQRQLGIGLCLRDHNRAFILAKSKLFVGVVQPVEVETLAYAEAIDWLGEMDFHKIIIEMDNKYMVDGIKGKCTIQLKLGNILCFCKYKRRDSRNSMLVLKFFITYLIIFLTISI